MNFMKRQQAQHIGASPHRRRRGSVLVLAVAVLAVLAALAVSYVTVVRVDRRSTDAYQRQENLQQQVGVVTAYLQSLLAADLFGNRIVNSATPRTNPFDISQPNWPKAFEDGEYADVPWTYAGQAGVTQPGSALTWDLSVPTPGNPTPSPTSNAILDVDLNERAYADDAWLAPVEPIDTTNGPFGDFTEWDTWPQITNLNSAYRWRDTSSFQGWARDRGRFVDLAQFLLQEPPNYSSGARPGYPGASLTLNRSQSGVWTDPFTGRPNGPELGVNQQIFDLQMSDLQEVGYWPSAAPPAPDIGQREFLPADERFWADTDGDSRPDARWQELDLLGNAFGLRWVVAARIIDNSALANVNSHLAFGYPNGSQFGGAEIYGDGRTPADVDLFRLIASQSYDARSIHPSTGATEFSAHPDVRLSNQLNYNNSQSVDSALERSWQLHVNRGVRAPSILEQLDTLSNNGAINLGQSNAFLDEWAGGTLYGDSDSNPDPSLIQALDMKRFERAHVWQAFGSNPFNPLASSGLAYPLRDEIDLRAYNGYNLRSFVSRLEQRLDGGFTNNAGFLPGTAPAYTDFVNGPGLGPMRAKEWDLLADSTRTYGNQYALMPAAGQYTNQEKLERLRKDIRHLLTTISGEGLIGPVPVLNTAPEYERSYTTSKVDLRRFATINFAIDRDRIRDPIEDAFEAFIWALAPLATNRPLMSPLDQIPSTSYADLSHDADLHYGGGVSGPATEVAARYGLSNSMLGPDPIGASYAVLRAASLAVNLADAIDGESLPDMSSATSEEPTLVRLFNQPDVDFFLGANASVQTAVNDANSIPLGVRFAQGDITNDLVNQPPLPDSTALPMEIFGALDSGVTLVGLDRQPFLIQVYSAAVYADPGTTDPVLAQSEIVPDDAHDQLGSILAVELGNPWPEPIDIADYIVRITPDGANAIEMKFVDFVNGDSIINPGRSAVFYFVSEDPTGPGPGAVAEWDTIRDLLITEIPETGDDLRELASGSIDAPKLSGIIFEDLASPSASPILLIRDIPSTTGAQVLVDRLTVDGANPNNGPFPATLDATIDILDELGINPSGGGLGTVPTATGRYAVQSRVFRPSANSASGFPAYVVERPSANEVEVFEVRQFWQVSPINSGPLPVEDVVDALLMQGGGVIQDLNANNMPTGALDLPDFELFVPNGPLYATSEIGQICAFTHMFIHSSGASTPDVAAAWDVSTPITAGDWVTISEQLGWDEHFYYDSVSGTNPNPYLGVLDFSRFILGSGGDLATTATTVGPLLPEALSVPLATRVFDAFEAIPTPDGVVRGRINVNTAPRRIIELLPFVDPRDPIDPAIIPDIEGWTSTLAQGDTRVDWLDRYRRRDADIPGPGAFNNTSNDTQPQLVAPQQYTELFGLRQIDSSVSPWSIGLVTKGELAVLGRWSNPNDGTINSANPAFLELGAPSGSGGGLNGAAPLDIRPILNGFEAQDDPEERLALFRAVSNIVSTRSDIFTAWFIIRAYDPKDIEAITIPSGMTQADEIAALMNPGNPHGLANVSEDNPGLLPTFERRVLVIFDRSNVRRPNDRPRVLMQVELPGG